MLSMFYIISLISSRGFVGSTRSSYSNLKFPIGNVISQILKKNKTQNIHLVYCRIG